MKNMSLWQYPEYIKFYISYFLGNVGDWFDFFAIQMILAHQFNASAIDIVYGLGAYMLPMILFASVAGSVADRFNKKKTFVIYRFNSWWVYSCFNIFSQHGNFLCFGSCSFFSSCFQYAGTTKP